MKLAFVTHFCPHYRVKTFEMLARLYDVAYLFYSAGNEWHWQKRHGLRTGDFRYTYLSGFELTRYLRVTPSLLTKLWKGDYDVFVKCINGRFALPATYLIARMRRKPFVLWTGIWMNIQTPFHRIAMPLTLWIYRHADAIVVYGEHVKKYLTGVNVAPQKIFVAAHAVDNAAYSLAVPESVKAALRAKLDLGANKIVLCLARLEDGKGIDYLIKAFARVNPADAVLVLAGDGSLRERLQALAQEQGIQEKTRFAGYVPPEDTLPYYAIAHLFVLPSVTTATVKETWGVVVNEAMNQGVPIVATEAVGAAAGGLVRSGVNGFVVPERDTGALAQAIGQILTDATLRKEMARQARHAIAEWNNERMVSGFQQAIEYAMQRRAKHNEWRGPHEKST
jgi:glycosyltransferase involved in cell wall biosynthesis